jgi:HPt (histidine-containing phosphotransfer) domain-containing protein
MGEHRSIVIGVSSYARPQSVGECLEAGMDELLRKPLNLAALEGVISRYLGEGIPRVVVRQVPPSSDNPERFDPSFLMEQFGEDVPLIYEVLEIYLEDLDDLLVRLRQGQEEGDLGEVADLGRRLQEAAINVGALALAGIGTRLQGEISSREELSGHLEVVEAERTWLQELLR